MLIVTISDVKRLVGSKLRYWGGRLDPEGAFQDQVAADVARRASNARRASGLVTGGGGGGGNYQPQMGSRVGNLEIIEIPLRGWK